MTILPDLHPRHLIFVNISNVRHLRLVNKEIGKLAFSAFTSCELYLGCSRASSPDPLQLITLLTDTQLQQLKVIIVVIAGSYEVVNG